MLSDLFGRGEEGIFSSVALWDKKGPRPPEDKEGSRLAFSSRS